MKAWEAICANWRVADAGEEPGALSWDQEKGLVVAGFCPGQELTLDLGNGVEIELVWIPPGEFMMGSNDGQTDEKPVHKVKIAKGFWMGKYEVTQRQYQQVIGGNPSYFKRSGLDATVENVSWNDAKKFCEEFARQGGEPRTFGSAVP